jgi:hypothetical protein
MQEFTGGTVSVEHHDRIFIELRKSYLLLAKLEIIGICHKNIGKVAYGFLSV